MRYRYIPSLLCLLLCLLCLLTGCNGGDTPPASDTPEESALPSVTTPADGEITQPATEDIPEEETDAIHLPFPLPTDELPVISVNTGGVAVDSRSYVDMTLSLAGVKDGLQDVGGEIRLRGNSTMRLEKKPYRIRLYQKHSLMGLEKAKSWVLLADYLDPSTLHNYAALSLAATSENFDFVPTPYKMNLYLNGEYQGVYTLCEQVQEQEGRLGLTQEITRSMNTLSDYNFLICMNYNAPEKPGAREGVTYFYISSVERYFELEYPTREDFPTEAQFNAFFTELEDYMRKTCQAFLQADRGYLGKNVNMDSLIDLFIVDRIMGERDHHWKSVFMYYKGGEGDPTLSFGPPWDYDFCMYTQWTGEPNEEFDLTNDFNPAEAAFFYRPLMNNPYYTRKVSARYRSHFSEILPEIIARVEAQADAMPESLQMNQDRWYVEKPDLTRDNLHFFTRYLKNRKSKLDREWG